MLYDHYHQDIQLHKKEYTRGDKSREGVRLSFPSDKKMEESKVVNGEDTMKPPFSRYLYCSRVGKKLENL